MFRHFRRENGYQKQQRIVPRAQNIPNVYTSCVLLLGQFEDIRQLVPTSDHENREKRVISSLFSGESLPARIFASRWENFIEAQERFDREKEKEKKKRKRKRNRTCLYILLLKEEGKFEKKTMQEIDRKKEKKKGKRTKEKNKRKAKVVAQNGRTKQTRSWPRRYRHG